MGSSSLGVKSASNEEHSEAVVVEPVDFLLDAAPALVQGAPSKADDKERAHHRRRGWEFLAGGGRGPGEPVHRDQLYPIAPRLGVLCQPRFERGFGAALGHVEQPGRPGPSQDSVVGRYPNRT